MSWTAPMTYVENTLWTAAQWNTHVRDNMLETMPGKAALAGRWCTTTSANLIGERELGSGTVATAETTTSASYVDLATAGPSCTITTSTQALVMIAAEIQTNTTNAPARLSYAISSATTVAAADTWSVLYDGIVLGNNCRWCRIYLHTGLTAGSNIFTAKYKSDGVAIATFAAREIAVLGL